MGGTLTRQALETGWFADMKGPIVSLLKIPYNLKK